MSRFEEEALSYLKDISFQLGDVNAIRNGEYEPPRGADPSSKRTIAHPDDIYNSLRTVIGLLERQNEILDKIGRAIVDTSSEPLREDYWEWLARS